MGAASITDIYHCMMYSGAACAFVVQCIVAVHEAMGGGSAGTG
ncbi:hypothetical protein GWL_22470 [Herbaspirillum sp. GW103]|nr:hypothetical protein GWL_22470 [Herbaspirillum sp. GW103]